MEFLVIVLVLAFLFGGLGAWVASQKNRSTDEGFALGFFFGPFGVLVEALLPSVINTPVDPIARAERRRQQDEESRAIEDRFKRRRADRLELADARRAAVADAWERFRERRRLSRANRHAWYKGRGVEPGPMAWFKVMPDWAQAIVAGLAMAFVVVSAALLVMRKI